MSLQTRISDLITVIGTDYKQLRTWISGSSSGDLSGLSTTAKSSLLAAINEVDGKVAPVSPPPPAATETTAGIIKIATQPEANAGTLNNLAITPLRFQTRLTAFAQPLDSALSDLAATPGQTAYGRNFLTLVNQTGLMGLVRAASETLTGITRFATQAETTTGTLDAANVTPLKLQQKLTAWAQPLSANLSTLAQVVSGAFGRTLLGTADAPSARTALGLANIATSGSASDLTTGTLPVSVLPPLAINDVFEAGTQAAMLALVAERGDIAIRTDVNRSFILAAEPASTLANWKQLTAGGDVTSVSGRTGAVTLTKADVSLNNVDNTSDVNKPVSTAQTNADNLRLLKTANLSDLANLATSRANLSVYSQAELGSPETDLVALYATAKL